MYEIDTLGSRDHLDRDNPPYILGDRAGLPCSRRAHAVVVLLVGACWYGVCGGWMHENLVLGDDGRCNVLGDHQAGTHSAVPGQERRQAAQLVVPHPGGPSLGDASEL